MSGKTYRKSAMPEALDGNFSPLFYLLGKLEGRISEDDQQQLLTDLLQSFPSDGESPPCPGTPQSPPDHTGWLPHPSSRQFISIMQIQGQEPTILFHGPKPTSTPTERVIELGPARIWEPLLHFQDGFNALETYYPLRAAAYYLRSLVRIWVELVEHRRTDILSEDEFLRLYLDAMLRVEAISTRCERCAQRANVNLQ